MKGRASAKTKRCGFKKGEGGRAGEGKGKKQKKKEKRKREGGKERKEKKIVSRVHVGCSGPFIRHMSRRDIERPTRKRGTERERVRIRERERERRRKVPQPASVSFHGDTEQWVRPISTIPPSRGRREIESREGGIF